MEGLEPLALTHDGVALEGYVARPEGKGPFPAVIVYHSGMGLKRFECDKAKAMAKLGYLGIVADMFGLDARNIQPGDLSAYEQLRARDELLRARVALWFDTVAALPDVDAARIGAFGFCMGGSCVLELARSGRDAKAVVSYHGVLTTHEAAKKGTVKPVVAAYCGLEDPYAPADTIRALHDELSAADAQFHIVEFAHVGHSFTHPEASSFNMPGIAYDAVADAVSWAGTLALFEATLQG
ncbi:MAG: dienelactone hydrolase family protein [Novosphingobium sp.]